MSDLIKLGLQIPSFTYPDVPSSELFEAVLAQAVSAEESGYDSVYVMDHFYQLAMIGQPSENMLECYTILSAIAARTKKVRLGAMVGGFYLTCVVFILGVLWPIARYNRISLWKLARYIRTELLIVIGTSSSESV